MAQTIVSNQPLRVRPGEWISRGWDCLVESLGINIFIGLVAALLFSLVLLTGPVCAGLAMAGVRKCQNGQAKFEDFLDGLGRHFLPALLSSILIFLFTMLGLMFLIVPGLVILAMYMFTFHYMVHGEQDFWQAMESSRKLVSRDYFGFVLFALALLGINILGTMLVVGVLFTVPLTAYALSAAYFDCAGVSSIAVPLSTGPIRIE